MIYTDGVGVSVNKGGNLNATITINQIVRITLEQVFYSHDLSRNLHSRNIAENCILISNVVEPCFISQIS